MNIINAIGYGVAALVVTTGATRLGWRYLGRESMRPAAMPSPPDAAPRTGQHLPDHGNIAP